LTDDDLSTVLELTRMEYHEATRRALEELKLTYSQLADQAASHRFDNDSARHVWLIIGGTLPTDFV
jgi:hypothetical protein